jgi:mannose-6-phosphate isomerase
MKSILKLTPCFKDYIWGGEKLKKDFLKKSELSAIAESWELACHKDGNSTLEDGKKLQEYINIDKSVLGTNCEKFEYFPILIKLIDAKENLSIQVHPDNEYALRVEGEYGKTEMWYILDCEPDAYLYYGFNREISPEEFAQRIVDDTILEVLNKVYVKKGDVFFIDAKTLHAIGKGILIAEIQQNSNTTYRIYDYNRLGIDNKPRELHIEKAKDVTALIPPTREVAPQGKPETIGDSQSVLLASCEYFTTKKISVKNTYTLNIDTKSFISLLFIQGNGEMSGFGETYIFNKGDSFFIPAKNGQIEINGNCELLVTTI